MIMRDKRKNTAYFKDYIAYENSRIEKKLEKLKECSDPARAGRVRSSLLLYQMNVLVASFSAGADKKTLTVLFQNACTTAGQLEQVAYSDAVTLLSFAAMLDKPQGSEALAQRLDKAYGTDKLLHGLATYIESGQAEWTGNYLFSDVYNGLDAVIGAADVSGREKALLDYLQGWYNRCSGFAWYDTLESLHDTYYGYWSFESAALAKIFGLNVERLSQNEYFPVL